MNAQKMSKKDRSERVRDLRELRHRWRVDPTKYQINNQLDIFLVKAHLHLQFQQVASYRKQLLFNLKILHLMKKRMKKMLEKNF